MHEQLLWSFSMLPKKYVILDTETTGLFDGEKAPDLVSIGLSIIENRKVACNKEFLVRPEMSYSDQADQVHGIAWQESQMHPALSENWDEICEHLDGQLVVAHNALFDWRVLISAAKRGALKQPTAKGVFCCQRAAQPWAMANNIKCSERGPSLDALVNYFGITNTRLIQGGSHGASIDAGLTALAVQKLCLLFEENQNG